MKLEIARGLFLVGSLGVASLCAAAWSEPDAKVVVRSDFSSHCAVPRVAGASVSEARPDQDLLLLMYGLSQSLVGRS
jgi:formate dehydrogenase assembly factor FdhD